MKRCCVQDNMQVRYLDWSEAVAPEQTHTDLPCQSADAASQASDKADRLQDQSTTQMPAPHVASHQIYDVIIGSDILYEVRLYLKKCLLLFWAVITTKRCGLCSYSMSVAGSPCPIGCSRSETKIGSRWPSTCMLCCQGSGKFI